MPNQLFLGDLSGLPVIFALSKLWFLTYLESVGLHPFLSAAAAQADSKSCLDLIVILT